MQNSFYFLVELLFYCLFFRVTFPWPYTSLKHDFSKFRHYYKALDLAEIEPGCSFSMKDAFYHLAIKTVMCDVKFLLHVAIATVLKIVEKQTKINKYEQVSEYERLKIKAVKL